ncbi:MAG: diphthine--ammonia ligase [Candidatus Omnitrophica bacterium]|nr:diphthine--ammonia ligase [Candidatus Omnitrophota bacterium]
MIMEKILFAWSGGKDSAMALYELKKSRDYEIVALLTTVTEDYERISMHGVRKILLEQQAEFLGLPLEKIYITKKSSNEEYEAKMKDALMRYQGMGVSSVAFGDIFLEDLKKYREGNLSKLGMKGIFPIWKRNSLELANTFIDLGFKAVITCIDSKILDKSFAGRDFDKQFLSELPANVDPCGENGEFHSFVYDGPIFSRQIQCEKGEVVLRDNRYYFCDLMPTEKSLAVGASIA